MQTEKSTWYDINVIRSYNRFISMVLGGRGIGKTFSWKEMVAKDFIESGARFIYMRRREAEVLDIDVRDNFWPSELVEKFPGHEFAYKAGAYYIDGKIAGYPFVLSTAIKKKGASYNNIKNILYDEFVIDHSDGNQRYLQDEPKCFLDAIETIVRRHDDVKIFMFANASEDAIFCPFFVNWSIKVPEIGKFTKGKTYVLQYCDDAKYYEAKMNTISGKFMAEVAPEYVDYAYRNKLKIKAGDSFLQKKTPESIYMYTLTLNGKSVGVWIDIDESKIFMTEKTVKDRQNFCFNAKDHNEASRLILGKNVQIKRLIEFFEHGQVYFDTVYTRELMYDFIKKFR